MAHPDGRRVDVHPVTLAADGTGVQPGLDGATSAYPPDAFATGSVGGHPVPCLPRVQQLRFHTGYAPRPEDLHDVALLRAFRAEPTAPTP